MCYVKRMVTWNGIYKYPKKLSNAVQNYTELSVTNHVINYQEACFSKIKHIFGISLK